MVDSIVVGALFLKPFPKICRISGRFVGFRYYTLRANLVLKGFPRIFEFKLFQRFQNSFFENAYKASLKLFLFLKDSDSFRIRG